MILQTLASYYGRLREDPDRRIAEPGFSSQKIAAAIWLNPDGTLAEQGLVDLREPAAKGKKLVPKSMDVPEPVKRTVGVAANFLWDNTGYALGADNKGKPERVLRQFEAFKRLAREVAETGGCLDDEGMRAVLAFLDAWDPEQASSLSGWDELVGQNLVFRLLGERRYVHDRPAVRQAWLRHAEAGEDKIEGLCLVSHEHASIARLHPAIKGVRGAQPTGAALVAFNLDAFTSFGKEQNYNAPISERSAFAYTTALNHLLAEGHQRVQIGDATTLFWSASPTDLETRLAEYLDPQRKPNEGDDKADDDDLLQRLEAMLQAVRKGERPPLFEDEHRGETGFYVLGLAPNASRLSVRFWHVSTVGAMAENLARHFLHLRIDKQYPRDPEFPSPWRLLIETATQRKTENIPPLLAGELARAILTGRDYPYSLVNRVIGRVRAEQEVTYLRAALLKAYYLRAIENQERIPDAKAKFVKDNPAASITKEELAVSLNKDSKNIGYRLGRLFAVLERAQRDALGDVNATIKDRFYAAASATPRSVFPRLLRLAQHHIAKAEYGYVSDIRLSEIMEGIDFEDPENPVPAHLDLDNQAMFALGYYHQRNEFYRKKEANPEPSAEQA